MLLWLCGLVVSVLAENTIQPPPADDQMKQYSYNCGDDKVLLKIWTVLSNLLDADGQTVKVPSRDQVQYGLTLIKKHILENQSNNNVDLQEKLFLREAELAKYKGVILNDNRPLQDLLEVELIPNNAKVMYKYELPATNNPRCREEFIKLIQSSHEDHIRLANSPVCSDANVEASISNTNGPTNFQSSLHKNPYNSINNLQLFSFNSRNEYNSPTTQNLSPALTDVNKMLGETQKLSQAESGLNNPIGTNLQHIVKLTKDRMNFFGDDFTANLEHAKNVADQIKALYQANNMPKETPAQLDLTHGLQLRGFNTNYGSMNTGMLNQPPKSVLQVYRNQNSNLNLLHNNLPPQSPQGIRNPGQNQTYTITNILQSQNTVVENTPKTTFVNSKYQPNPRYNYVANSNIQQTNPIRNLENLQRQTYSNPTNTNFSYKYSTAYNIVANTPQRTEINRQPGNSYNYNYNVYRYSKPNNAVGSKASQNDYPYQPISNPVSYYPNFNQPNPYASSLRPNNAFRQVTQNVYIPQPQLKEYLNNAHIQNYKYTSLSHVANHNAPNQLTQPLHYNNQPVIDKLADFIAGTNAMKLNSNMNNDQGEIELTYLVKEPPPVYQPRTFYIKFRLPYKTFAKHINELLTPHPSVRSADDDLYKDLASQFNGTVISSDLSQIPKEHLNSLEDKRLVRARFINPNSPEKDDNLKSVDIINLIKEVEQNNSDVVNPVNNNEPPNAEVQLQPPQ